MKADQYSRIDSIKIKARADYKCQRCGSDELIQAHAPNGDHIDWRKGIAFCGSCHADEHPDVPRSLFLSKVHQPYWHNISARALAIEFNCSARTIIRHAKHLGIASNCDLTDTDKKRIKSPFNSKCPGCETSMHKAGKVWSGKNRVQRYRCNKCGRTTTKKEKLNENR